MGYKKLMRAGIRNYVCSNSNAKQKHPGVKKVRGQSEAALQISMCDQKL